MAYDPESIAAALDQEQQYPIKRMLINGDTAVFRPLEETDEQAFREFYESQVPQWETEYLRHDVRDPSIITGWIKNLDYRRVFPLLAFNKFGDRVLGVATLHFMQGVQRHVAEVRLVVGKDCRKVGLGSLMVKELIRIGNDLMLYYLVAEVPAENQSAVKAFRQLGFEVKCTLEDYFMTRQGKVRDIVLMMKRLKINWEDAFFLEF